MTPMPRPTEIFLVFSIILTFLLVFILHLCYFLSEVIYCHDGYQYYFHFGNEVGIILVFHCFRISMHCYFYSMPTFGLNHTGFALYIYLIVLCHNIIRPFFLVLLQNLIALF